MRLIHPSQGDLMTRTQHDNDEKHGLRRRSLLTGVGAGAAGAAVLAAGVPAGHAATTTAGTAVTPANRFGRIFPSLPPFVDANDRNRTALIDIGKPGGLLDAKDDLTVGPINLITDPNQSLVNRDNPTHTAGTTFFGQFLDHDLTFDQTSPLGVPAVPEQ